LDEAELRSFRKLEFFPPVGGEYSELFELLIFYSLGCVAMGISDPFYVLQYYGACVLP
jgi:hypothetical protein